MKQRILSALAISLSLGALAPNIAYSEDIDVYSGVDGATGKPNVLFFVDNTSNWSANNQKWTKANVTSKCNAITDTAKKTICLGYVTQIFGTANDLVQGQVELRALKLVLNELVCKTGAKLGINAGLMLFNDAGSVDSNSVVGGYIRHRIAPMDSSRCSTILNDLDNIDSKITQPDFKGPSSTDYGTALFEAFKYFGGWTNPSGSRTATAGSPTGATGFGPVRYTKPISLEDPGAFTDSSKTTYKSPLGDSNICGNNYIVLIGNKFPNQEYGTDQNANPPTNTNLTTRLAYNHGAQIYPVGSKSLIRFADEWAKFLYNTDVSDIEGQQNVRMFTIDVYNGSPDADQGKLLKSMADQSGAGGYFAVNGDLYALIQAFTDILTQIASVDSVFASASLPVSVNAQGTFLNQVFMGVFRPDAQAQQRWMGNLKQYKFALNNNALSLVDAAGNQAVDAQNSGFILHCARSFWTSDSNTYWETISGFNEPSECNPTTNTKPFSDSPDGPLVERGGAAQRLRALGYSSRNMKTCTSASNCSSLVDFTSSNVTISPTPASSTSATLVDWVRGRNLGDGSIQASTGTVSYTQYGLADTATRPTVHGAVIHSRPLAVNYGINNNNDVVVFYGADDGTFRAVNGNQADTDGNELWSFIAPEHWTALERVRTNSPLVKYPNVADTLTPTPTPKTYFFDGSIGGYQEKTGSAISKLWIYPTMRRGGRGVYAFDVTKKPSATSSTATTTSAAAGQPTFMWRYNDSTNSNMGQSWSTPTVIRVKGISQPFAVFGAGYNSCEDDEDPDTKCGSSGIGKGIVVTDAEQGPSVAARTRFIGVATNELDSSAGRFVADITPVDVNRDGYVDVLYAVDTRGNVWRINTSDPSTFNGYASVNDWDVVKIAEVSQWGSSSSKSERRKFMYAPSVVSLGSQVTVLVGTGDREKPSASSNAAKVKNRFYGIRDDITVTTQVSVNVGLGYGSGATSPSATGFKDVTSVTTLDPTELANYKGWFIDLATTTEPYEQVVTTPVTLAGVTYFNTYRAKSANANSCVNLGTGYNYQIDFQTGTKPEGVSSMVTQFVTQGIPPSPVGGLVQVGDTTVPFIIGGPGPTPISPAKITPVVKPDRRPTYRYRRIDN
jgi:type IV pilus assembly protein PilY1